MDIYKDFGVKRIINAMGPYTKIGGSLMAPEVIEAMAKASKSFVDINELLEKAGKRIAEITGSEAAYVSSGAAAGLAVATAACMAGTDPIKAKQLPDTSGMKDEVIILRCHRIHYDQAIRVAGAHFVEVGFSDWSSPGLIQDAISDITSAIAYIAKFEDMRGSVPLEQVIDIARDADIPLIVDAADELPPVTNLYRFTNMGADLVIFSGGKDIQGPQGSGIVLGRKDLIEACAVNGNPNYGIGRPMKVDKETIIGILKAVELYVEQDFEAEMEKWESQRDYLVKELSKLPHVKAKPKEVDIPGEPGSFHLPTTYIELKEKKISVTRKEVVEILWEGSPRIAVEESPPYIVIRSQMLKEGEEKIIADRFREIIGRNLD